MVKSNTSSKSPKEKLVLFDIDGTLTSVTDKSIAYWKKRIATVFEKVFDTPVAFELEIKNYNGMVDKKVLWKIAEELGISKNVFEEKFDEANGVFHEYLKDAIAQGFVQYFPIVDARSLVEKLPNNPHITYGLVTGNVEKNGWLKLQSAALEKHFEVGGFGDTVYERVDLVHIAIDRVSKHYQKSFLKDQIVVIGDTVHDIVAARGAGVYALGVATGHTDTKEMLEAAGADLVVDSLLDSRVLTLLDIQ
jgi:phosphoglycolate phosphatase-like HAD superfamily hydrolase